MMDEINMEFDLTTIDGFKELKDSSFNYDSNVSIALGSIDMEAAILGECVGSVVAGGIGAAKSGGIFSVAIYSIKRLFGKKQDNVKQIPAIPPDTQLKFAQMIITLGKKNGVKKLKITVDKDVGASVGASYASASIKGKVDADRKFHLEVEYK